MDTDERKIGVHKLIIGDTVLNQCVVVITEGRVVNYFQFHDELPMVEWFGGTMIIKRNEEGILEAYQDNKLIK